MGRRLVLVAVALLALAGCSGVGGPAEFAPGVTNDRVVNTSALSAAHDDFLANLSYTFTRNASQRIEADGYTYTLDHATTVRVGASGDYLYRQRDVVDTVDGSSHRLDAVWSNGTVAVMRTLDLDNDTVSYARYRPPEPYIAAEVTRSGISSALETAAVVETWNESERRFARLASNESETRRIQARNRTVVNATMNREATAIVREDGFVPRLAWTIAGDRPLPASIDADAAVGRITDTTRIRYSAVGATAVPRPGWVAEGLAATDALDFEERTTPRPVDDD